MVSDAPRPTHWTFDGLVAEVPTDSCLRRLLARLVEAMGMVAIAPPQIEPPPNWMALQLIAESHISLHGGGGYVWVDVFSCREFSPDEVQARLETSLGGIWQARRVERGYLGGDK